MYQVHVPRTKTSSLNLCLLTWWVSGGADISWISLSLRRDFDGELLLSLNFFCTTTLRFISRTSSTTTPRAIALSIHQFSETTASLIIIWTLKWMYNVTCIITWLLYTHITRIIYIVQFHNSLIVVTQSVVSAEEVVLLRVIVVYCYVYGTRLGPRRPRTPFFKRNFKWSRAVWWSRPWCCSTNVVFASLSATQKEKSSAISF